MPSFMGGAYLNIEVGGVQRWDADERGGPGSAITVADRASTSYCATSLTGKENRPSPLIGACVGVPGCWGMSKAPKNAPRTYVPSNESILMLTLLRSVTVPSGPGSRLTDDNHSFMETGMPRRVRNSVYPAARHGASKGGIGGGWFGSTTPQANDSTLGFLRVLLPLPRP